MDESSLLWLDPDEKLKLDEQDFIILNFTLTSPKTLIEIPTKSYVVILHESSRDKREWSSVFNDQDNEFNKNELTNLDNVTNNRNSSSVIEISIKYYVDDSIGDGTLLRFYQTLQNYLNVSVRNESFNLTNYNKIQFLDTTEIKFPNIGSDLLQKKNIKCSNKNNESKVGSFMKWAITNSSTSHSGST